MLARDTRLLGLLPALGLCSCAAAEHEIAAPEPTAEPDPRWIELESPRRPLTTIEAAARSGELALAAGDWVAARASFVAALSYEPGLELADLTLGMVDASIGLAEFDTARAQLDQIAGMTDDDDELRQDYEARRMQIREAERALGPAPCEVEIDSQRRPLAAHEDFRSAWKELHAGLSGHAEIPIPADADQARLQLKTQSRGDFAAAADIVSLVHGDESSWGLVLAHEAGGVSVVPDLVHQIASSCSDDTELAILRRGDLLWVRAISDSREFFDSSEWDLGSAAALGSSAVGSSGYQSSGYYAGSSGYQSSGYASSGYYYSSYGCSGYDYSYDYESCVTTGVVERDLFISSSRGEIVLDIVRTGELASPLGTVELDGDRVRVESCGVEQSLALSWTS